MTKTYIPLTSYLFDRSFVTSMSDNVPVGSLLDPLKDISSALSLLFYSLAETYFENCVRISQLHKRTTRTGKMTVF